MGKRDRDRGGGGLTTLARRTGRPDDPVPDRAVKYPSQRKRHLHFSVSVGPVEGAPRPEGVGTIRVRTRLRTRSRGDPVDPRPSRHRTDTEKRWGSHRTRPYPVQEHDTS